MNRQLQSTRLDHNHEVLRSANLHPDWQIVSITHDGIAYTIFYFEALEQEAQNVTKSEELGHIRNEAQPVKEQKFGFRQWIIMRERDYSLEEVNDAITNLSNYDLHDGDCVNISGQCALCSLQDWLNEYAEYYFDKNPEPQPDERFWANKYLGSYNRLAAQQTEITNLKAQLEAKDREIESLKQTKP